MTGRPTVPTRDPVAAPPESGALDVPSQPPERHRWSKAVTLSWLGAVVVVVLLLSVVPWLGAIGSVALLVAVIPCGDRASTRLVATVVAACGLLALALALGQEVGTRVLTPDRVRAMVASPVVVAVIVLVVLRIRGRGVPLPRLDLGLLPLLVLPVFGWWATGRTAVGTDLGQEIGGLMLMGWDHQSHFSVFSFLYEQGGVYRSGPDESASMFLGYPPLAGAIGVLLTLLVGADGLDPTQQLPYYVQTAGVMFGLSAALLGFVGAGAGRRVVNDASAGQRAGAIAAIAGTVAGGYVVFGPSFAFFDYGFTNFLFGVALATATSWLAVVELEDRVGIAAALTIAGTAALGLLWTPLVLLLVPTGVVLLVRLLRRRLWPALVSTVVLAGVGMLVAAWQVFRIAPSGGEAVSLAQTLAGIGGGQPAAPLPHLAALSLVAFTALFLVGRRGTGWWALLLPVLAAAVLTLGFTWNTMRLGLRAADSYYVAKALWAVYFALIPVVGAGMGMLLAALSGAPTGSSDGRSGRAVRQQRIRLVVVGVAAAAVVWFSAPTPNAPNGSIDYYALPVGGQAMKDRWSAFRNVPQGDVVARAEDVTDNRPRRLAIAWDSGDLLTNRWLASLRGDLDGQANAVYTALAGAPYVEPARDALRASLVADPSLEVVIAVSTPESRKLLRSLVREFPDRVALRQM